MSVPVVYTDRGPSIVDPDTGEIALLADAPAPLLARVRQYVAAAASEAYDAKRILDNELAERMKADGAREIDTGSHRVELTVKREWDKSATWAALSDLVVAGHVSGAIAEQAMPEKTERKPDGRKLNALVTQLAGENPEAAGPLARARTEKTSVRVESIAIEGREA